MYVNIRGMNRANIHTHKNKVKLFLKIDEKYCYIWICHVEKCSGFILVNMGFHKFKNRHVKHALVFGNSNFRFKISRIKSCDY
jgi:hypothetical protein